jgi:hypothetical protein
MIVDDDPVVVDESIKFSFDNVNNEVVLVNNTSTLSTVAVVFETIFERPSLDISDSLLKSLIYIHVSVDKVLVDK